MSIDPQNKFSVTFSCEAKVLEYQCRPQFYILQLWRYPIHFIHCHVIMNAHFVQETTSKTHPPDTKKTSSSIVLDREKADKIPVTISPTSMGEIKPN